MSMQVLNVTGVIKGQFQSDSGRQCTCCTGPHRYSTTINFDNTNEHIDDLIRRTTHALPSGSKIRITMEVTS